MSTRAQIIVKDRNGGELWFYRHSDGYPEGTLPTLQRFMEWVAGGKIRQNVEQAAGWLILIGADEYGQIHTYRPEYSVRDKTREELVTPGDDDGSCSWKCGAYEPCAHRYLHGDIEYLYTLNLGKLIIEVQERDYEHETKEDRPKLGPKQELWIAGRTDKACGY